MANSPSGDSMIDRIVRVLETFAPGRTTQTPAEVARRAQLPSSSGHRLVRDLVRAGLLERDTSGEVRIGMRLWELTSRGSRALALRQLALPHMLRVQAQVREHTQLAVREGCSALFLERISQRGSGSNLAQIAGRLPLHASSAGLVLLAHAPETVLGEVLARPLERLTEHTITDPVALRHKLAEVRTSGAAVAPGSIEDVATGIAVPVAVRGRVIAALSAVLPRDREDADSVVLLLQGAARAIGHAATEADTLGLGVHPIE